MEAILNGGSSCMNKVLWMIRRTQLKVKPQKLESIYLIERLKKSKTNIKHYPKWGWLVNHFNTSCSWIDSHSKIELERHYEK